LLCSFSTTDLVHYCPVTAIAAGTAKFKIIDASTVAAATATSNEVTVTVSAEKPASVKLAFDKATYAPFEKATITVTPVDAAGKAIAAQTDSQRFLQQVESLLPTHSQQVAIP
jgi:trimeric autotransporter adhesin